MSEEKKVPVQIPVSAIPQAEVVPVVNPVPAEVIPSNPLFNPPADLVPVMVPTQVASLPTAHGMQPSPVPSSSLTAEVTYDPNIVKLQGENPGDADADSARVSYRQEKISAQRRELKPAA